MTVWQTKSVWEVSRPFSVLRLLGLGWDLGGAELLQIWRKVAFAASRAFGAKSPDISLHVSSAWFHLRDISCCLPLSSSQFRLPDHRLLPSVDFWRIFWRDQLFGTDFAGFSWLLISRFYRESCISPQHFSVNAGVIAGHMKPVFIGVLIKRNFSC